MLFKVEFVLTVMMRLKKMKIEIWTILIPKGNSYCRRKSSPTGPRFKVSSEGLSAEIDIHTTTVTHPSTNQARCC